MAPKGKQQSQKQAASKQPQPTEYKTIGEKRRAEYLASRALQVLHDTKGWDGLTAAEKTAYSTFALLESEAYTTWSAPLQKDFLKLVDQLKIQQPLPEPYPLGKDRRGNNIEDYTLPQYEAWKDDEEKLRILKWESETFREKWAKQHYKPSTEPSSADAEYIKKCIWEPETTDLDFEKVDEETRRPLTEEDRLHEQKRRAEIVKMESGKQVGRYEGDPTWDDVTPIPQDDGKNPLAAIAYTDEYAEAISYLRAVMASKEHSPRALALTSHIISLNPAHYTVWLYRASTLFALTFVLSDELAWLNEVALNNQKNYQIWHHRQLLIDNLYPTISASREKVLELAESEMTFLTQMFAEDSKNYHVWSYRQYLVRKLDLFPSQCEDPSELRAVEKLIEEDVRNNSAWSHRFFLVFSDPGNSTQGSKATEVDPKIPAEILDREIRVAENAIYLAPQNQSPWNFLRGVLRKGGRELKSEEGFAGEFVKLGDGEGEEVRSSHALDFLADVWVEKGEAERADAALRLLGEKYDGVRRNYWEWRRAALGEAKA
ncbi:CAAX geranylgeranyltransferase alpha subunit [Pseudogymnoascus destructans]|uniref:Protein farnesyltransferase/geranylgeranyltransferase type-1 subunit alpha n=1 Tax=Pseudogymnoascus destructans TaxID=655981 RepID=A0A177AD90_9PEZI|nr:CAAX geranylgeranyltransferase alpha subunit [Pseudogymnoascus destructans]OAF60058.1 CAAX geranylgeranyltransferase alpha subunit [Pseudogymnoascus destructans]